MTAVSLLLIAPGDDGQCGSYNLQFTAVDI